MVKKKEGSKEGKIRVGEMKMNEQRKKKNKQERKTKTNKVK